MQSSDRLAELNECIRQHLGDQQLWFNNCELRQSSAFGCGIFAIRDIEANEVLFYDLPLMLGPTGKSTEPIVCAMCYRKLESVLNPKEILCKYMCGIPICKSNDCADNHKVECALFSEWKPKNPDKISFARMKGLMVNRSLLLSDQQQKFLGLMQKNSTVDKFEMYFRKDFENFPSNEVVLTRMRNVSVAINTNAHQNLYRCPGSDEVNVRALYPIVSLLNHHCVPNTRRTVDAHSVSCISAARKIAKNEQIFASYSQMMWGTNSRRMYLLTSKQFLCTCDRCIDPTEFGTNISGIRCANRDCDGIVLPIQSINFKSIAKCGKCDLICENKRYLQIQEIASAMVKGYFNIPEHGLNDLIDLIETKLKTIVPESNQAIIETKLEAIWKFKPVSFKGEGVLFRTHREMFDQYFYNFFLLDLETIAKFCEDVLGIVAKLGAGDCIIKGFLLHKLYTIRKKMRNFIKSMNGTVTVRTYSLLYSIPMNSYHFHVLLN